MNEYVLYQGDSAIGKVFKVYTPHVVYSTKWRVIHPGGEFIYYGSQNQLERELNSMGYSI